MYNMRPPPNSQLPGVSNSSNRFYELLDALKIEYDMSIQQSAAHHYDSAPKMTANEYDSRGKSFHFFVFMPHV